MKEATGSRYVIKTITRECDTIMSRKKGTHDIGCRDLKHVRSDEFVKQGEMNTTSKYT